MISENTVPIWLYTSLGNCVCRGVVLGYFIEISRLPLEARG